MEFEEVRAFMEGKCIQIRCKKDRLKIVGMEEKVTQQ